MNLFETIRSRIASPARTFIIKADGSTLSYGDMLDRTGQLANALVLAGVEPGDRVAVQVEKSVESFLVYLATLRAGAVYLPLNTAYTLAELDYFIGDAEPKLVVCDPVKRDGLAEIAKRRGVVSVETLDANGRGQPDRCRRQSADGFRRRAACGR